MREIRKVAVLGAGTMGARIAAHLANAGVPSVLLDIGPPELTPQELKQGRTRSDPKVRNRIAQTGLDAALKSHPARILSGGGECTSPQRVSEQCLLGLEREAFVSLCGEEKTQKRIQHMPKKGKALRK